MYRFCVNISLFRGWGRISRIAITGSYGSYNFVFFKKLQNGFLKWLYPFTFPTAMFLQFSTPLLALGTAAISYFVYSDDYVVVSQCGVNLHLPRDPWFWISFHVLIFHLYVFFGEIPLHVFCLFVIRLLFVCFFAVELWEFIVHFWCYFYVAYVVC